MVRDTNIHTCMGGGEGEGGRVRPSPPRSCTSVPRVNRCTYIRALAENDYVVNEREAARRTRHGENGQERFVLGCAFISFQWHRGISGYINAWLWVSWCRRSRATAADQADARETKRPVRG